MTMRVCSAMMLMLLIMESYDFNRERTQQLHAFLCFYGHELLSLLDERKSELAGASSDRGGF
jgi:hypothetical protein